MHVTVVLVELVTANTFNTLDLQITFLLIQYPAKNSTLNKT